MSPFRAIQQGLKSLFRRAELDRELDDEVRHYIEQATRDNIALGMTPADAERAARIAFGGVEAAKEDVRRGGWEAGVDTLWQDVRYGIRGLRRNPAFTAIAVVTLALGVGANTAMFSVVNAVMLRPLPYRESDRLAMIWTDDVRRDLHREATSVRTIDDWRRETRTLQSIAYFSAQRTAVLTNDATRERTRNALVSANFFSTLGVAPIRGRWITSMDDEQRAPVAVISYSLWQRRFGGADDVIGKTLVTDVAQDPRFAANGVVRGDSAYDKAKGGPGTLTIIGVMPAQFYFPETSVELWIPATTYWRFARESSERFPSWARRWTAIARVAPGASIDEARADLARIGKQLAVTYPSTVPDFPGFSTNIVPLLEFFAGNDLQTTLWMLLGAVGLVLLVACANVANLLLARGATRQREFAVRRALGAGRARLIRQLIAESGVLAAVGGVCGVLLAAWGTRLLASVAAAYVPRADEITLDARVLAFAAVASVVAGLVFGLAPAFRVSAVDAGDVLKDGQGPGSARLHHSRGVLVIAECSLAIVLLAGGGPASEKSHRCKCGPAGF